MQKAFDKDWDEGRITYEGWQKNASDDGVMAYKLLSQTGEKETINRSIVCIDVYVFKIITVNSILFRISSVEQPIKMRAKLQLVDCGIELYSV